MRLIKWVVLAAFMGVVGYIVWLYLNPYKMVQPMPKTGNQTIPTQSPANYQKYQSITYNDCYPKKPETSQTKNQQQQIIDVTTEMMKYNGQPSVALTATRTALIKAYDTCSLATTQVPID